MTAHGICLLSLKLSYRCWATCGFRGIFGQQHGRRHQDKRLPFLTATSPTRTRPGTVGRTTWISTTVRRQWLPKMVIFLYANGTSMCTIPSALCPGCWPGMTTRHKAHFLGRSERDAPYLSCLPSFSRKVKGDLGTSHRRILNHGLANNKYVLEKWKKEKLN